MEPIEMTAAWNELQNRVERVTAQSNRSQMGAHRRQLRRLPTWDLVVAALTVLWVGNFAADHIGGLLAYPVAAIPAIMLFVFAIVEINLSIRHLIVAGGMDLAKPIVDAQRDLANLRKLRVKVTRWIFICALPAWVVFPILLGQSIFGVRFIFALDPAWIAGNIAFGVAMIPLVNWLLEKSKYAGSLQATFAGKNIVEAEAFLKEVGEFRND